MGHLRTIFLCPSKYYNRDRSVEALSLIEHFRNRPRVQLKSLRYVPQSHWTQNVDVDGATDAQEALIDEARSQVTTLYWLD